MLLIAEPGEFNELLHGLLMAVCHHIHADPRYPADIYGDDYENDTFQMSRYCWCENEDCGKCDGSIPNFHHKPSGFKIWWYKYIGRGLRLEYGEPDITPIKIIEIFYDCIKSLSVTSS